MSEPTVIVKMDRSQFESFMKPVRGQGGFQTLMKDLHGKTSKTRRQVKLTSDDLVRVHRYATRMGQGGFQNRLSPIIHAMEKLTDVWVKILSD